MTAQIPWTMPAATALPFCWKDISAPASRTPTPSSLRGISPTAICARAESQSAQSASVIEGQPGCRTVPADAPPPWHPYYSTQWKDARDVSAYVEQNYASLRTRTVQFKNAVFNSTFPPYVLDAVSANLAIVKAPTILREANGNVWGWEGCFPDAGCCHGSCTHVWNYAQALPHLYPQLERTLRDLELGRSMDDRGHVNFRGAIPDGPVDHTWHAAADGQLGGIMKVFRDWQISGDTAWLKRMYPLAKRSIDYCIATWDPDHRGALFEPHHNTYDIEFWGPDGMCTSIYLGALSAMAQMATAVGESADATLYGDLAQRWAKFMDETLFNGDYYQQKVEFRESPRQIVRAIDRPGRREEQRDAAAAQTRRTQISIRFGLPVRRRYRRVDGRHLRH